MKSKVKLIDKPWGHEEILEHNENYTVKRLLMKHNHCCSLQMHIKKHETIYVLSGVLEIACGDSICDLKTIILRANDYYVIKNKKVHRMYAILDCIYLEASTSQLDDVVRLADNYGRI